MTEKAMFGAGCFWGVEASFRQIKGVKSTAVGYSGGTLKNPTYEHVCSGTTGHAEVVQVEYDPAQVTYAQLLDVFWKNHNPTTLNFLPDTHIVVLKANDVVGDYESLWGRLRQHFGGGAMPRTINLITGPSCSADIEQTLILGAHGPRRLHVIIVGQGAS